MTLELSDDQSRALDTIVRWYNAQRMLKPFLTLGGLAGTGKTTVVAQLERALPGKLIRYCAFTAKAASVLRDGLEAAGINVGSGRSKRVSTVHGLIKYHREIVYCVVSGVKLYDSRESHIAGRERCGGVKCQQEGPCKTYSDKSKAWEARPHEALSGVDLIVLDEASMINEELWNDLLSYGRPILAVGDHGQLPPVAPGGRAVFNLMDPKKLDIKLEKIHRQAEDSPIIKLASYARNLGSIPYGIWRNEPGQVVAKLSLQEMNGVEVDWGDFTDIAVLCGRNTTRQQWNQRVRGALGRSGAVQVGDRVTCLRNSTNVYNGMLGTVTAVSENVGQSANLGIRVDGTDEDEDDLRIRVALEQFGQTSTMSYDELRNKRLTGLGLWDFGYVTTVHKAQGSSIDRVIVIEERLPGGLEKHKKWLYTAVTRARKSLIIVG